MAKITLNDISNITGNPTSAEQLINANFTIIEEAIENTLSRDGTAPNALGASLDANSHRIVNLPYALSNTEPVTLAQVMALVTGGDWTGGVGIPAVVYYQDTTPTATAPGQVWVRTNGEIYIWSGTAWVRQQDPLLSYAITQADTATSTALAASSAASAAASDANDAVDYANSAISTANTVASNLDLLSPRVLAVEQDVADVNLAIIDLENEDVVLAGQISTVTADLGDLTAAVATEEYARIQGDTALASAIQNIQVSNAPMVFIQASAPVAGVGGVPDPIPEYSIWYDSDDGNHQYRFVDGTWTSVQDADIGALYGLISSEQTARIDGDAALALDITAIQAQRDDDYALIVSNNQARVDGDAALAISINGLTTNFNNLSSTVATESATRASQDAALASSISSVQASVSANQSTISALSATVTTNDQARVSGDAALASSISAVNTTVGSLSTTVSQHTSSINGIQGKYTVKIDANGYISGFGLIATNNNAAPTSTFTVLADNFKIVHPGSSPVSPFYVTGGVTYIRNVVIDEATIGTATISTIKLADNAVTEVYSTTLNFQGSTVATLANVYYNLGTVYGTAAVSVADLPASGAKVHIRGYFNAKRAGGTAENCFMRIRRDDGVILPSNPQFRLTSDWLTYSWEWVDHAPVTSNHTYTVQITRSATGNTGNWEDIQLTATVLKR
jgi:hypothetical protein